MATTEARERAAKRTLKLRGQVVVRPGLIAIGALSLFVLGLVAGGVGTYWVDRQGWLPGAAPTLAEAPAPATLEAERTPAAGPTEEKSVAETSPAEPAAMPEPEVAAPESPVAAPAIEGPSEAVKPERSTVDAGPQPAPLPEPQPEPAVVAGAEIGPSPVAEESQETDVGPMVSAPAEPEAPPLSADEVDVARVSKGAERTSEAPEAHALEPATVIGRPRQAAETQTPEPESAEPEPAPEPAAEAAKSLLVTVHEEGIRLSELLPPTIPRLDRQDPPALEAVVEVAPLPTPQPSAPAAGSSASPTDVQLAGRAAALGPTEAISSGATPPSASEAVPSEPAGPEPPSEGTLAVAPSPAAPAGSLDGGLPPWQRFAAVGDEGATTAPMVALVIDDVGLNRPGMRRAIAMPAPLTLAFLTYAPNLEKVTAEARRQGHELIVHVPMEPIDATEDPGPRALRTSFDADTVAEHLTWALSRFEGYVGLNNHMGSKFTAWPEGMSLVMAEARQRGLLFLDSVTSDATVAASLAKDFDVPFAERDVFLDNQYEDPASIRRQLAKLEALARSRGYAIGIGHPHRATLDVVTEWIPAARARGIRLVPVSAVVRHRTELAAKNGRAG